MKPVRNNVLVKPFPPSEQSEGGIFVPLSVRKDNNRGTVVAVGNGTKDRPMQFKRGQIVYRVFEWGTPIEIQGEKHFLMDDSAILATE